MLKNVLILLKKIAKKRIVFSQFVRTKKKKKNK